MRNIDVDKEIYQNIFDAYVGEILVMDNDGYILLANPACEKLFGYESGELEGKSISVLIPKKLRIKYQKYIKDDMVLPANQTNVYGLKKNGDKISMNIGLSPTIAKGKSAIMIFSWDATQQKNNLRTIKKTNKKLIESNRKFDALINNLNGIVFRCKNNQNLDMDFISNGSLEITGYRCEDFKNHKLSFGQLIVEEDREQVWKSKQKAIKEKKQYDIEYRINHKNGSIKYVLEKGKAIYNENNEVEMLEGFISDITPLRESLLDLHKSDAKIKAFLQVIPDAILVQDREGTYLDWYANNPNNLFMPPQEFIGLNMKEALPKSVYQQIKKSHDKVIETGTMQIAEYSFLNNDSIVHHEARVVLMNDHSLLTIIRDVTQKKATDALLFISNNALASTVNSIIISDAQLENTPIIYCNQAFEKMTGYTKEEVLGRDCQFLQNDDRDQQEIEVMHNSIMSGKSCNVILRNYKKDGTLFWNNVTITPVFDEDNIITHFISVLSDVTSKIKAENLKEQIKKTLELIAKDKSLKTIGSSIMTTIESHIQGAMVSVFLLDNEKEKFHKLVLTNLPTALKTYIEDEIQKDEFDFAEISSRLSKNILISDISKHDLSKEYKEIALKNGVKSYWSYPIKSSSKEIIGVVVIFNSIARTPELWEKEIILEMIDLISIPIEKEKTAVILQENKLQLEKHAQKLERRVNERTQEVMATVQKLEETNFNLEDQILKAQKSEEFAKTSRAIASEIAKNFPNGFVAVMDKDLKVLFAEGEGLEQLGLGKSFYEGMYIDEIFKVTDASDILTKKNVLQTLKGNRLSFEIKYKDRYFAVNTLPLVDDNNQINNSLHVYSDISLQKEVEFTIQKALEKERELNGLKSRFISMASHEFRTPLSAILTSAILINKQNDVGDELKRNKYVAQIEKNVTHLTEVLNDFLSLSKLEEGDLVSKPERFDVISFSESFLKESTIGVKKEQTIVFTSTKDELYAHLDKKLLTHIFNNLISNATKYSPIGSQIYFKVSQLEKRVVFEVTDHGIGIPKEEQKHTFSRFFRAKNALNIEGTGLGLNIVKHYTELMGGTIRFKSELNKGTTFWIEFPN